MARSAAMHSEAQYSTLASSPCFYRCDTRRCCQIGSSAALGCSGGLEAQNWRLSKALGDLTGSDACHTHLACARTSAEQEMYRLRCARSDDRLPAEPAQRSRWAHRGSGAAESASDRVDKRSHREPGP
eukprot:7378174-Prymnesium_polylepis.3